jgi:hypothetical protein
MEGWVVDLAFVASNGNLTQLYPAWCSAGINPATATNGQLIRQAIEGILYNVQVQTDLTNAGIIEIWDINGADAKADVSSATVITDAQKNTLVTAGQAKLVYSQNFIASPETPFNAYPRSFQHGLAARFVGAAGSIKLNLVVAGGYRKTEKLG